MRNRHDNRVSVIEVMVTTSLSALLSLVLAGFAITAEPHPSSVVGFARLISGSLSAPEPQGPGACATPASRQFDFWLGDWDAYEVDASATVVAHAKVNRILNGCVLHEDYQGTDGHKGESFTIYDGSRNIWHQTWVTNRGQLLQIEGKLEGGKMMLSGSDHTESGQERLVRGTWQTSSGGVRETAARSVDGGKTWVLWFDIVFRPHNNISSVSDDEDVRAVGALDTAYQSAVSKNDSAIMDRILADDFVLVTGTGKTFTKADLLEEARSRRLIYERQEDSDRKVRVWSDTAVVTAKLWAKGTESGKLFEYKVWFSDLYIRTPQGWRYVFGQSSLRLPKDQS